MKIGDRVYVHGFVDEIRKDCVIIRNDGGYFGTVKSEIVEAQKTEDIVSVIRCKDCKFSVKDEYNIFHGSEISNRCIAMGAVVSPDDYCSWAERKEE